MSERGGRWRDLPDAQRAKQILVLIFWSAVIILYLLGAFSLVLRSQFLSPIVAPTVISTTVLPTSGPTLFPTLTPSN
jgi:heme/copper-type cytochrome/quinol oxidase subunit 1